MIHRANYWPDGDRMWEVIDDTTGELLFIVGAHSSRPTDVLLTIERDDPLTYGSITITSALTINDLITALTEARDHMEGEKE